MEVAAEAIAAIARDHEVVVTHGNGPQVGLLALQSAAYQGVEPYPLDVLDAESEGMVGYLVEQALGHRLDRRRVAALLTQIVVDASDPAFGAPTKPIGPMYPPVEAERQAAARGWTVAPDGEGWRRVVPSPEPREIVELAAIEVLLDHGITVICAGGGGIPVVDDGGLRGVEAVIDKDLAASLLAAQLHADALLLLTDVDGVYVGWGTAEARLLSHPSVEELRAQQLPSGSMGPKVEAAIRFVAAGGALAGIGSLTDAVEVLAARAGTVVTSG